ncbi:MAG: glycosyltransferase family 2 protein [Acidobacteriota bacterium]
MIAPLLCSVGIVAGFLLIGRMRTCPPALPFAIPSLSIIIPARNEERNLPRLLASIGSSALRPAEVVVVDDGSSDNTAAIASGFGATVLHSAPLPQGWNGKTWACHQGTEQTRGDLLLFLDADTWFVSGGLNRLIAMWERMRDPTVVLSLLPWHAMKAGYEQLSLFFNLLMASAGFAIPARPRLFGQSLLLTREMYVASGGHAAVRGLVLENFVLADRFRNAGARLVCLAGAGTLHMRMFPDGSNQMRESWAKGFALGAAHSESLVVACSIVWISALWSTVSLLLVPFDYGRIGLLLVYLLLAAQLAWLSRRVGSFHPLTCLLYPVPLAYFCGVFAVSAARRARGRASSWRGRAV